MSATFNRLGFEDFPKAKMRRQIVQNKYRNTYFSKKRGYVSCRCANLKIRAGLTSVSEGRRAVSSLERAHLQRV